MSDLLNSRSSRAWLLEATERHSKGIFGKISPAVIWSDSLGNDGNLIVPVDPEFLAAKINTNPHIILHDHDPGKPKGQVLEAESFISDDGRKFVAAILGFYAGGQTLTFDILDSDVFAPILKAPLLPPLPATTFIEFAVDPRDIDEAWITQITSDAPVHIERTDLSHNAADSLSDLIRIGIPYLVVVWNPFVKAIATEAGKDVYKAIHGWLSKLFKKIAERGRIVLDIHTFQDECQVSFIMRSDDPAKLYAAHNSLSTASVQAALLVAKLKERGMDGRQLIYEYSDKSEIWFPSYAILKDNRIITDNIELIGIEQLPSGLSLGLTRGKN